MAASGLRALLGQAVHSISRLASGSAPMLQSGRLPRGKACTTCLCWLWMIMRQTAVSWESNSRHGACGPLPETVPDGEPYAAVFDQQAALARVQGDREMLQ